jgi:O-antigen biosynthesis protein
MPLLRKAGRIIRSAVRLSLTKMLAGEMFSRTRCHVKRAIALHKLLWVDDRVGALEHQSTKLREQIDLLKSNKSSAEVELPPLRLDANFSAHVTIVIPVFNHLDLTYRCLNAILQNTQYPHYEIVLVDDGSIDGTTEYLKKLRTEKIKTLFHDKNLGIVDGCNSGAGIASGDYLLFLNSDTEVQPGWLTSLVRFAERTPDCGAVGSKLIFPNGKLQEAGSIIFSDGGGESYGRDMDPNDPKFNFAREVDYCSGAALLVRRDLWKQIGGFDRRFAPAYYEDPDLCFEIRSRGYKVYYQPKSVVIHHEGQTAGTDLQSGYKRFQVANQPKFVEKWATELQDQYACRPDNIARAANRRARKSVLVVAASVVGAPDQFPSSRSFHILELLVQMNFHVTLVAIFSTSVERCRSNLEEMGIEVHVGDAAALKALGQGRSGAPTVNYRRLFTEREFDYAIIAFWPIAGHYLPLLRAISPRTQILLDTVDGDLVSEMPGAELGGRIELRRRVLEHERRGVGIYGQADRLWVEFKDHKEAAAEVIRNIPIDIIPTVVREWIQAPKTFRNTSDLLFWGNFLRAPDIDGIRYFCKEVFPLVLDSLEDVKLYIVGPYATGTVKTLASERIFVMGNVADVSPYLLHARISVAPALSASVNRAIGEALAWGLPVVTTAIGAKGVALADGEDVLIAETAKQFAARVVTLYDDEDLWNRLSTNGRKRVEEWSPEKIKRRLEVVFREAEVSRGALSRARLRGRSAWGIASVLKRVLAG